MAADPSRRDRKPDAAAAITAIYERYRETISDQVAVLEEAVAAVTTETLDDDLRERARREAHKLAGSAGTFGFRRASDLAREIEAFLKEPVTAPEAADLSRLKAAVRAIREELAGAAARGGR